MVKPLTLTSSSSETISHEVDSCCKYCSVLLEIDQITEIDHPILTAPTVVGCQELCLCVALAPCVAT